MNSYNKPRRPSRKELERMRMLEQARRQQASIALKKKRIAVAALATLMLASILLFSVAIYELCTGEEKYIYAYNGKESALNKSDAFSGDVQLVDMNMIAELCSLEKTTFFSRTIYRANGTEISLENGSDRACVNSIWVSLSAAAKISDEHCLVPLADVISLIPAISASSLEDRCEIRLNVDRKNVYIMASSGFEIDYHTDVSAFLDFINTKSESVMILANKKSVLGKDHAPSPLVEIPAEFRKDEKISLYLPAERALEAMMQDMRAIGFSDVYVTSAYRSYEYQENLFESYIQAEMAKGLSYDQARAAVLEYSAAPGTSEHQTGLCVDFFVPSVMKELENYGYEGKYSDDVGFAETSVYSWLVENSWKYGFILRYPKDKVSITEYQYESWHYRFIGLEAAARVYQSGLSYEEYLEIYN